MNNPRFAAMRAQLRPSAEAEEALLQFPGVDFAAVDLSQKHLRVSGPDEDTILDAIDDAGLLLG